MTETNTGLFPLPENEPKVFSRLTHSLVIKMPLKMWLFQKDIKCKVTSSLSNSTEI